MCTQSVLYRVWCSSDGFQVLNKICTDFYTYLVLIFTNASEYFSCIYVLHLYGLFLRMRCGTNPKPTPVYGLVLFSVRQVCANTCPVYGVPVAVTVAN